MIKIVMNPKSKGYILVTPAKNEEKFLPKVAESVINQTHRPRVWVIVDDGSTDKTPQIIERLKSEYSWIKSIRLESHPRDIVFHYAYVCRMGFRHALSYAKRKGIPFGYIALLDADTVVEKMYFEKLIKEFQKDPNLGIVSGSILVKKNGRWEKEPYNTALPRGSGRMWNKYCFFETGGYRLSPSPDSVSNRLASKLGWKIAQIPNVFAYQLRATNSAEGYLKGFISRGKASRYVGKDFISALAEFVVYSIKLNPTLGFAFIVGYMSGTLHGEKIHIPRNIQELFGGSRNFRSFMNNLLYG